MGLDFALSKRIDYGDAPRWSYSGFMEFRRKLAEACQFDYEQWIRSDVALPATAAGLAPLFEHSDCDGDLYPEECAQVAPKLREICLTWPAEDYHRQAGLRFADMMDVAAAGGARIVFC